MRALFIRAIPAVFVLPLFTTPGAAQERCKFSSDSDPATEYQEILDKARALFRAAEEAVRFARG